MKQDVLCRFTVKGSRFCLWIYAVPVSENCTRLIINAGGNFPKSKPAGGLKGLKARLSPQPLIRSLLRQLRCVHKLSWKACQHRSPSEHRRQMPASHCRASEHISLQCACSACWVLLQRTGNRVECWGVLSWARFGDALAAQVV